MKHNIIAAAILAVGLVLAAFIFSGRYSVLVVEKGVALRVDRWTGKTKLICPGTGWTACDDAEFERSSNWWDRFSSSDLTAEEKAENNAVNAAVNSD